MTTRRPMTSSAAARVESGRYPAAADRSLLEAADRRALLVPSSTSPRFAARICVLDPLALPRRSAGDSASSSSADPRLPDDAPRGVVRQPRATGSGRNVQGACLPSFRSSPRSPQPDAHTPARRRYPSRACSTRSARTIRPSTPPRRAPPRLRRCRHGPGPTTIPSSRGKRGTFRSQSGSTTPTTTSSGSRRRSRSQESGRSPPTWPGATRMRSSTMSGRSCSTPSRSRSGPTRISGAPTAPAPFTAGRSSSASVWRASSPSATRPAAYRRRTSSAPTSRFLTPSATSGPPSSPSTRRGGPPRRGCASTTHLSASGRPAACAFAGRRRPRRARSRRRPARARFARRRDRARAIGFLRRAERLSASFELCGRFVATTTRPTPGRWPR